MQSVPVLMYHHVLPHGDNISVSVDLFQRQMQWLTENGWYTLSAEEFLKFKQNELSIPKKSVLLTFDDGWLDNYLYAYPILKAFNHHAIIFLVTDWTQRGIQHKPGKEITWHSHQEAIKLTQIAPQQSVLHLKQIEEMLNSNLIAFESHTHHHLDRRNQLVNFEQELSASQTFFKQNLGYTSRHLCYPLGYYQPQDAEIAKQQGFELCYTIKNGANCADKQLTEIKRFSVKNKSLRWFAYKLFLFNHSFFGKLTETLRKQ